MRLRCVTINLKGLADGWFETRGQALIEGVKKHRPDLVCFQEATIRQCNPLYHQARAIGQALGLENTAYFPYGNPAELVTRDQGGVALTARWPLADVRGRRLSPGKRGSTDARVALFANIRSPDGLLGAVTTHLSWRPDESQSRLEQMNVLLGDLVRNPWGPGVGGYVLMGDLNASPEEPAIEDLRREMKDVYGSLHPGESGHTWSARNPLTLVENLPDRRIDYIFCDRSAMMRSCEIILEHGDPVFASDHFGVLAELEWL